MEVLSSSASALLPELRPRLDTACITVVSLQREAGDTVVSSHSSLLCSAARQTVRAALREHRGGLDGDHLVRPANVSAGGLLPL